MKKAILTRMHQISGVLKDRLFKGYGPLGSFSAKIDFSYALSIITKDIFDDLRTIKDIRNEFAHPKELEFMSFSSPEILSHMKRLHSFDSSVTDYEKCFLTRLRDIENYLNVIIFRWDIISSAADDDTHGA